MIYSGDRVFAGRVRGSLAFVVEGANSSGVLYIDTNGDESISAQETFVLQPDSEPSHMSVARVSFPLAGPRYLHFPVDVYVYERKPQAQSCRVGISPFTLLRGHVDIKGKPLLVKYEFDRKTNGVRLDSGSYGMDLDGDRVINRGEMSLEYRRVQNEAPIFRLGDLYLSTKELDLANGTVVLQSHPASAYSVIELARGSTLPDFGFTDFSARTGNLSEFRDKFVLLDCWATWCRPCVADMPHLKEVSKSFRSRGLEILGMNGDDDESAARKMIAEKGLNWRHATKASIHRTLKSLLIDTWPTYVLIDWDGKIISANQIDLSGKNLDTTLENLK
jgi:thiol-disulfide isomerase/thioredoxin